SDTMKFIFALISLLVCCSLIKAQGCPTVCPAIYAPVCGQAQVGGKTVQCQFPNACTMSVSGCKHNISKSYKKTK
ncbi:hypothetical protein KR222_005752, partial [Zaprionus bogoriensis]